MRVLLSGFPPDAGRLTSLEIASVRGFSLSWSLLLLFLCSRTPCQWVRTSKSFRLGVQVGVVSGLCAWTSQARISLLKEAPESIASPRWILVEGAGCLL